MTTFTSRRAEAIRIVIANSKLIAEYHEKPDSDIIDFIRRKEWILALAAENEELKSEYNL